MLHVIWICEKRSQCRDRVWTNVTDGEVANIVSEHNHAVQVERQQAIILITAMNQRARTTYEQPQQILASVLQGTGADLTADLT